MTSPKTCGTAGPRRLTRDQLGLAPPVACTQATQIGPEPSLTSANAAKSDARALSWQLVLTHRQASPLLTSNALTWEWHSWVRTSGPSLARRVISGRWTRLGIARQGLDQQWLWLDAA
jgi:hypothetical protein